jgi:hypothetical protein
MIKGQRKNVFCGREECGAKMKFGGYIKPNFTRGKQRKIIVYICGRCGYRCT